MDTTIVPTGGAGQAAPAGARGTEGSDPFVPLGAGAGVHVSGTESGTLGGAGVHVAGTESGTLGGAGVHVAGTESGTLVSKASGRSESPDSEPDTEPDTGLGGRWVRRRRGSCRAAREPCGRSA